MPIDFTNVMKDKTKYFSMQEIDKILKYCVKENRIRDYMLILTLVRTGRRISEIVGTKPYNINVGLRPVDLFDDGLIEFDILKKNHIKSKKYKNKKESKLIELRLLKKPKRVLKPVDKAYFNVLSKYISKCNIGKYDRIFQITRQRVHQIINDICKKADVTRPNGKVGSHMFRHSIAINLLKNNPTNPYILLQIQRLLDHSSLNITQHYTQFTPEDIKESLEELWRK